MYKSLDVKGINVMRINAAITGLIILIITRLALYLILPEIDDKIIKITLQVIAGLIIIFVLLDIVLFPAIRYKRYKYLITNDRIEVQKGLFMITTSIIQIKRIQKIELSSGPIDRRFNLSNVHIYTAAGVLDIKFLNTDEAKEISKKVNNLLKQKITKKRKTVKKK